jgi:hypothetical protein
MTGTPTSPLERRDFTSQREWRSGDGHDMQLFTVSWLPQIISASANGLCIDSVEGRSKHARLDPFRFAR